MKKLILSILLILSLLFTFPLAHGEEITPHIVYTNYDGLTLFGLADVPEDGQEYWARLTFFLPGNDFILLFAPIGPDGVFQAYIYTDCVHLAVQIVDDPCAIAPGTYTPYDAMEGILW